MWGKRCGPAEAGALGSPGNKADIWNIAKHHLYPHSFKQPVSSNELILAIRQHVRGVNFTEENLQKKEKKRPNAQEYERQ